MSPRRVPVSRRDRPVKPPLSRDGVVATALRVMREEGLERVTMRRLAAELDTGPASLYVYVRNTAELHGALLNELLTDLELPGDSAGAAWREQLIDLMTAYTRMLFAYPSLARSVLTLRPCGPHYLRLIDSILGLLDSGGIPARQAAWGVDLLLQHATATAAEQGSRKEAIEAQGEEEELVAAVAEATSDDYPHIVRARGELFSGTGLERMHWAFRQIINGLTASD
ncbi:TetR/AcrR family transcriptional regulator C-terminal domain-containing protein [Dactylosporangium fulvum]|uniref:TetR/AcrR family transcriptional regulator n=1 Tax=Dactylosporangium fulvum TaxID=53359 RepID=A0ABY5W6R3_9ACTN|nr:TetR/AcrR family transcriptional regulator [Dactylosporangium fulvum]UWP85577.1 TetR/AcrR family transcriptional regulator [Dactylosporangium fulvum]